MTRTLTRIGAVAVLAVGLAACSPSTPERPSTSTPTSTAMRVNVSQHETIAGTPIVLSFTVPDGSTQLGPLVRSRSAALDAAYAPVLAESERLDTLAASDDATDEPTSPPTTTETPSNPLPTADSFRPIGETPEPDTTTALLRVDDDDPGKVFSAIVDQIAEAMPGLDLSADAWSQFCSATDGTYTGCALDVTGRTTDDVGLKVTATLDTGDARTKRSPAGSQGHPVVTWTVVTTDPPDMRPVWQKLVDDQPEDLQDQVRVPTDLAAPTPQPATTEPVPARPEVEASWPSYPVSRPVPAGSSILTPQWKVRPDTSVLLSGDKPAFALLLVERGVNADAVARGYVLPFSTEGEPFRDVVQDRTEIATTYRARAAKGGATVSATFTQAGRGNYIALFFTPAS